MSHFPLTCPSIIKEKKSKRKTIFKTKRKEILNNDLAVLPSHDNCSMMIKFYGRG